MPCGLPPRTWGRRRQLDAFADQERFTPTHVGTTALLVITAIVLFGLPPRTWGRPQNATSDCPFTRFTPTHVGTTIRSASRSTPGSVYPHARGDDDQVGIPIDTGLGLPPRTWGRHLASHRGHGFRRFTPTHVGTTDDTRLSHTVGNGLPPRTWGRRRW